MYFDTFLYAFLAWYIDNVFPGEFGTARPPWFFLTKKYWNDIFGTYNNSPNNVDFCLLSKQLLMSKKVSSEMQASAPIIIRKLQKTFTKGLRNNFIAVDGLDLTMYDGQITALLGHNGAGIIICNFDSLRL